jgi:uncharacterized protein (TIGR03435 family)
MIRAISTAIVAVLVPAAGWAQPQNPRPVYEAASVKPNTSGTNNSSSKGSKGQIAMVNQTLKRLIERAYSVMPLQVSGPSWMENLRFDVIAKYPEDTQDSDRALMLRALLEDRFKLAVHRETRDLPGYEMVIAKGGSKLKPAEPGGSDTNTNNSGNSMTLSAKKTSMEQLAGLLTRYLGDMVIDKTGLTDVYDFDLSWVRDDPNVTSADAGPAPSLFSAVQEALGLRLQPKRVPVEVIVIDHAEKVPTEN